MINYNAKSAKLSDFKSKLILLDFWATWCTPCVAALPKLNSLQQEFKDEIQVIAISTETSDIVQKFLKSVNGFKNIPSLLIASDAGFISKYLKFRSIPHEVWIGNDGVIKAITSQEYVTVENVRKVLANQKISWPIKDYTNHFAKGALMYDFSKSFAGFGKYYSGFSSFIGGASRSQNFVIDSVNGVTKYSVYNFSIPTLYSFAYNIFPDLSNIKRCILEVRNPSNYFYNSEAGYRDQWNGDHWFSYESLSPLGYTNIEARKRLINDLDFFFRIESAVEKRSVPCLRIIIIDSSKLSIKAQTKGFGKHEFILDKNGNYSYVQEDIEISYFIQAMNSELATKNLPLILSDSEGIGKISLSLNIGKNVEDLTAWRQALGYYGLDMVIDTKEMDMLIIREKEVRYDRSKVNW